MLFTYKYISHDMEKMQKYMDFIFFEVWCKAQKNKPFKFFLFNKNKELKKIIQNLYVSDSQNSEKFLRYIEEIYYIFQKFNKGEKFKLKRWYLITTNIKRLCDNSPLFYPLDYNILTKFNSELSIKIKNLYSLLYGTNPINELKELKLYTKTINEHYKKFMEINDKGICPFCGLHEMKGIYHTKREAYDHFLPKGKYPFNSINFKNLAPMCSECNSSYKLENNPIFDKSGNRRKAFYPYEKNNPNIDIKVKITSFIDIKPENITLTISAPEQEKVNTWIDLFSIEERYKAFLSDNYKDLLVELEDEVKNYGITKEKYLEAKKKSFLNRLYSGKNFLKLAFLKAYENG